MSLGRQRIRAERAAPPRPRREANVRDVSQENVERVRAFIAAFNRGDFDAAVQYFDRDVDWVLPARQRSDSCRGTEAVKRFWSGLDETFEELRLEPQEFVDAGDHVATRLRFSGRGKGSGAELDAEMYHQVVTFRDGRMTRIEYVVTWGEALAAAGVAERASSGAVDAPG
jgi:ketosteroid isomerase-like protein